MAMKIYALRLDEEFVAEMDALNQRRAVANGGRYMAPRASMFRTLLEQGMKAERDDVENLERGLAAGKAEVA